MSYVTYAQNFEDVLLWRALRGVKNGRYIDVGAQDPIVDSLSLSFYEAGWRGVHVEPTPFYAARLREARPDELVIQAAVTDDAGPIEFFEFPNTGLSTGRADIAKRHRDADFPMQTVTVPCTRLDRIFDLDSQEIQWLKIDVEGMEADVLRSWGKSPKRPWFLIIESTAPNSQEPTEHLWLEEVVGRGYRDVFFDGLSRFFVHESKANLASNFGTPPNVFDGFEVSRHHFATRRLRDELEDAVHRGNDAEASFDSAYLSLRQAEERLAQELERSTLIQAQLDDAKLCAAGEREEAATLLQQMRAAAEEQIASGQATILELQIRVEGAARRVEEEKGSVAALQLELAASEQRLASERASVAALQALLTEVGQARDRAEAEHRFALKDLRRLEAEHSAAIHSLWLDKQAAEHQLWQESEVTKAKLQQALEAARAAHGSSQQELSLAVERFEQSLARETDLQQRLSIAELQLKDHSEAAVRECASLADQLQRRAAQLGEARTLIQALVDSPSLWARIGAATGFRRTKPEVAALQSWLFATSCSAPDPISPSTSNQAEYVMQLPRSNGGATPYLRADSLPDLLSWNDVDFVRCAYVTVLGRRPDREGEAYYTSLIRGGTSKLQVLWQLRTGEEAKSHDPGIAGFDRTLRQFRMAKMPLIGPLMSPRYSRDWSAAEFSARRIENSIWRSHGALTHRLGEMEVNVRREIARNQTIAAAENSIITIVPESDRDERAQPLSSEPKPNYADVSPAVDLNARFSRTAVNNVRKKLGSS